MKTLLMRGVACLCALTWMMSECPCLGDVCALAPKSHQDKTELAIAQMNLALLKLFQAETNRCLHYVR